jgi:multidrug transporter EmrE-like cation transporter
MRTSRWAMVLVLASTLSAASGQILIKMGVNDVDLQIIDKILADSTIVLTLVPLAVGYFLYALAAGMLIVSLKYGQLSVLYPIYAMNFVWVAVMSPVFFETDSMSPLKWAGVAAIVAGVSLIGLGSRGGGGD